MLDTPHRGWASSPIFKMELRRLGRFRTALQLKWYTLFVLSAPSLIFINIYLLLVVTSVAEYNANVGGYATYGYTTYGYYGSNSTITSVFFLFSLTSGFLATVTPLAMLVTDFNFLSAGLNAINQHRESGQWEMLRLTPLAPEAIIGAKLATVQIRAWRPLALELGLRLLPIVVLLTLLLFNPDLIFRNQSLVSSPNSLFDIVQQMFTNNLASGLAILIILLMTAYSWMSEPIWRMRAMTALSMSISSRTNSAMMSSIYGFFTWIGLRIVQVFSLGGIAYLFFLFYTSMFFNSSSSGAVTRLMNNETRQNFLAFMFIAGYAIWIFLLNRFYAVVRTSALRSTIKRAFSDLQ